MKVQEQADIADTTKKGAPRIRRFLLHGALLLFMGVLLFCVNIFYLTFDVHDDVSKYQCYAVAFWQGVPALHELSSIQCPFITLATQPQGLETGIVDFMHAHNFPGGLTDFVASQSLTAPFHALPHEYPLLTLVPFSLPMLAPPGGYHAIFVLWMFLAAALTYFILNAFRSTGAALAFVFYLLTGAWSTVLNRFDLLPALLTLGALVCADRSRWKWAFALLALATLTKFYPLMLVLPFFIGLQKTRSGRWYAWSRWSPLLVFVAVCAVIEIASLLLSVEGTLAPLGYFGTRPIQVESFAASLMWISSFFGLQLSYVFTYGSLNVLGDASNVISIFMTVLLFAGLLYTWWLQARGRLDLAAATLLTLLIVIFTGKVFSPQYLIWIAPLVAYVGANKRSWLISWGVLGVLTTIIYPFVYRMVPLIRVATTPPFYPLAFVRNLLLGAVIVALLLHASKEPPHAMQPT